MAARPAAAQRRMQAVAKGKRGGLNLFDSKATSDRQTGLSRAAGVGVVEDVAGGRAEDVAKSTKRGGRKIFWWVKEKKKKRRLGNQRRKSLSFLYR